MNKRQWESEEDPSSLFTAFGPHLLPLCLGLRDYYETQTFPQLLRATIHSGPLN